MTMTVPGNNPDVPREEDPIHGYFGLSYASYLVIPRSLLQSMPTAWQEDLVDLLTGLGTHFGETIDSVQYKVIARDKETNLFVSDPLGAYRHNRHEPDVPFGPPIPEFPPYEA